MEEMNISPQEAFQAYQRFTSTEIARLYAEISGRDAVIEKLFSRIQELEVKIDGQG